MALPTCVFLNIGTCFSQGAARHFAPSICSVNLQGLGQCPEGSPRLAGSKSWVLAPAMTEENSRVVLVAQYGQSST